MTPGPRAALLRYLIHHRGRRPDLFDLLRYHRAPFARSLALQAGVVLVAALFLDAAWTAGFAGFAIGGLFSTLVALWRSAALWPLHETLTDWAAVERLAREHGLPDAPRAAGMVE